VPGNIQSIERAAAILRLLSGRTRRLGVVDLAGELGLPKGTVHGLLRTLQHVGFVEQDPETGKYQLGAALLHMGSSYLDGNELRTRALNWSDSLASRTQEAVRIGTLHEGKVLIVHHVFRPDDSLQTLDVGSLLPAHATALGKMLLAHHPYALAELAGNGFASYTDATICDLERLERELARSRDRGWAADVGELRPGQVSLAAPIMDRSGVTVGAMGIFGPPERLLVARQPRGELLAYVREAARAVSRELGAIPW
jgi:DNA-binding IclR family transcriptional regulator